MTKRNWLILEGNWQSGPYQIGAIRAMKDSGVRIDGVIATGTGILNALLLVSDRLTEDPAIWVARRTEAILDQYFGTASLAGDLPCIIADRRGATLKFLQEMSLLQLSSLLKRDEEVGHGSLDQGSAIISCQSVKDLIGDQGSIRWISISAGSELWLTENIRSRECTITYIEPRLPVVNERDSRYLIQLGYFDALRSHEGYSGKRFYIEGMPEMKQLIAGIAGISDEELLTIRSIWPDKHKGRYRYLFDILMRQSAETLGLSDQWTYEDVAVGVVEYFLKRLNKHRFTVYVWDKLRDEFTSEIKTYKKEQAYEIALEVLLKALFRY